MHGDAMGSTFPNKTPSPSSSTLPPSPSSPLPPPSPPHPIFSSPASRPQYESMQISKLPTRWDAMHPNPRINSIQIGLKICVGGRGFPSPSGRKNRFLRNRKIGKPSPQPPGSLASLAPQDPKQNGKSVSKIAIVIQPPFFDAHTSLHLPLPLFPPTLLPPPLQRTH